MKKITLDEAIQKLFPEHNMIYFTPADIIKEGDHYLRYDRIDKDRIKLTLGTENGELPLMVVWKGETLIQIVNLIIYGK